MDGQIKNSSLLRDTWFWTAMVTAGSFLSLTLWFGLAMDQSIYAYGAWVWKHFHQPPYLGVWDQNFPGIFIIHRIAMGLFGESILGFRIFDFLVQTCCLAMIFYLAKRLSGISSAGFLASVMYGIYYFGLGQMPTGERESFVFAIFLWATVLFLALGNRPRLRAVLVGLLLGSAFLIKPTFGLSWLIFGAWFLRQDKDDPGRGKWIAFALFALFCLAPAFAAVLFYWRIGGLDELYQAVVWYNFAVYAKMSPSFFGAPGPAFFNIYQDLFKDQRVILLFGFAGLGFALKAPGMPGQKSLVRLMILLMLAGFLSYLVQGKFFSYHLIPFWGFMIVFSGAGAAKLGQWLQGLSKAAWAKAGRVVFYLAIIALMLAGLARPMREFPFKYAFGSLDRAYLAELGRFDGHMAANYYLAAKELELRLRPGDRVEFFGPYPLINFVLKNRLPSRFPCAQSLLLLPGDGKRAARQQQWIKEYSASVIAARPRFFLVSDYFPGQNNQFFNFSNRSLKKALELDFPELDRFLKDNYILRGTMGKVEIYELNNK